MKKKVLKKDFLYLRNAVEKGNPDAMNEYANILSEGKLLPNDKKEAACLYKNQLIKDVYLELKII